MQRAVRHLVQAAFVLFAIFKVMLYTHPHYFFLDLVPEHFQRFLDSLNGELGSLAAAGCFCIWPHERAQ